MSLTMRAGGESCTCPALARAGVEHLSRQKQSAGLLMSTIIGKRDGGVESRDVEARGSAREQA